MPPAGEDPSHGQTCESITQVELESSCHLRVTPFLPQPSSLGLTHQPAREACRAVSRERRV